MTTTTRHAAREVGDSKPVRILARAGYAANGVVHILIGVLVLVATIGGAGGEADQNGALKTVADAPGGIFLLWVIAVGVWALALYYITEGIIARGESTAKKWAHRLSDWGRAVVYIALGFIAATIAMGGNPNGDQSTQSFSAQLLSLPGGPLILGAVGLGVVGVGGYFVFKGITQKFKEDLSVPGGTVGKSVTTLGVVGYVAKGIALGIVGILLVVAAVQFDPEKAGGLDQAFQTLLGVPGGPFLAGAVGVGLIAYGVYCFARARYARL
ncbi:DUF1206 domain-containing protein [Microbacterium awajiense]